MTTYKTMAARKTVIRNAFEEAGMTRLNGKHVNLIPVWIKTKTGKEEWAYSLVSSCRTNITNKILGAIRTKNGLDSKAFIACTKEQYNIAIEKGKTKEAANIIKINTLINTKIDSYLEEKFGYLKAMQIEFFELDATIKRMFPKTGDLDLDIDVDLEDNLDIDDLDVDISDL